MHELSLLSDLLNKIERVSQENGGAKVVGVTVKLGAMAHISPGHFSEHFVDGTRGQCAEGAELTINVSEDTHDPHAQDIMLESVDVA
ncbi:MAG: hydrogenase/urease maturation nickel metallochaperone HypA [Planctomycetota bacterium]|jgi:hydrogenase nickel incorporation protein HypA/HybF